MAAINRQDIISNDVFTGFEELEKQLRSIIGITSQLGKSSGAAQMAADTKNLTAAEVELEKVKKRIVIEQSKQNDEYIQAVQELKKTQQATKELTAAENRELGTLEKLTIENKQLTEERKKLNLATDEGKKRLTSINQQLDINNKKTKESVSQLEKQRMNVGNYTQSIKDALPMMGRFGSTISTVTNNISILSQSFKNMVPAVGQGTSALGKLKIALISTGIGAIVVALGALIAAFASTERGMDALMSVLRPVQKIFQGILGIVQDLALKAFDRLKEAINNPKEAFEDLGRVIKENIINRFKALQVFGEAISLLFEGKWKESAKKYADAWIQAGTGIENGTDKIANAADAVGKFVTEAVNEGKKLFELEELLEQRQIDLTVPLAKARDKMAELHEVAVDNLKTNEERVAAYREEEKLLRFITAGELELKKLEVEILKQKQKGSDVSAAAQLELQQLIAETYEVETKGQREINALLRRRSGLEEQILQARKDASEAILAIEISNKTAITSADKKATDDYLKELDKRIQGTEDAAEKEKEIERLKQEKKKEIIYEAASGVQEIMSNFTSLRIEQIGQELNALEHARDREIEAAGDNARLKNEIDKKYDKQKRDLQRKQANAEKANSLFQIAINTAVGIAKTIAQVGLPAAIPLIATAAVLGAAQAAFVLAQPLPKFDKGTESTPSDYIAGEKRPELRKSKGKWSLVDKPTLFTGSQGDKIVSGKQTDSILGNLMDIAGEDILTDKRKLLGLLNNEYRPERKSENLAYVLQRNNEQLIRTIQNKKEVSVSVNSRGNKVMEKSGNVIVNRIDWYYSR